MIKKYCDVCNKETVRLTEYILPESVSQYATAGKTEIKLIQAEIIKPVKKELCPKCEVFLRNFLNLLPILSVEPNKYKLLITTDMIESSTSFEE